VNHKKGEDGVIPFCSEIRLSLSIRSPEQLRDGRALIGDRNGAGAVEEFPRRIDPHRGVDRRVEIRNRNRAFENGFAHLIGDAVGALVLETSSGEDEAEAGSLVAAAASAVVGGGASEFGADGDESFVEEVL